jgi:hypothetical protein
MEYNPKKVFNTLFGVTTPKERVLNAASPTACST